MTLSTMFQQEELTESELRARHLRSTGHNIAMGWPEQSFAEFLKSHYPKCGHLAERAMNTVMTPKEKSVTTPDRQSKWREKNKERLAAEAKKRRADKKHAKWATNSVHDEKIM